jgi:predicted transport protein
MNTADQNVFTLDTAFKRRWILESINNSFELDENTKKQGETLLCGTNLTWRKFVEKLNETILESNDNNLSSEDNRLGVFFARGEELTDKKMFAEKVLMYLWNDALKFCDTVYRKKYRAFDELLYDFINDEVNPFSVFAPSFEFDNVKFADSFELTEDDDDIDSITTEQYLHDKNLSYIDLYNNLKTQLQEKVENVSEVATKTYLALRYNTTNIACIRIMQNEIQVCTKEPTLSELKIGSKLSSGYRWSNDYKIILTSENVSQVRDAIINAYGLE